MSIRFTAMPTETVRALRAGGPDAYGMPPEHQRCDGPGYPCRHCLKPVPEGQGVLVLAHRPFPDLQPFAETGPIFLCAEDCERGGGDELPNILSAPEYIVRGYGADDRIVYGTGAVTPTDRIVARAEELLADPHIAYVHVRSARNNCYQCRIERA